jgi:hypothetical protein
MSGDNVAKKRFKIGISFLALVCIFLSWGSFSVFADSLPIKKNGNCRIFDSLPFGPSRCVVVRDDIAFAANGGTILSYDVSNVSTPVKISEIRTSGIIMKIAISGNYLYVAAGSDGMYIYDIKDRRSLQCVLHLLFERWCSSVYLSENLLFLGQQGSLKVFKINNSDPADVKLINEISICGQVENMLLKSNMLFVSCRSGGLYVFDLENNFKDLKHIYSPGKTTYALADLEGYIYFNLGDSIYVLDSKDFVYKKVVSLSETRKIYHMLIRGNYVYIYCDELMYCFQIKTPFSFRYKWKKSTLGDHVRQGVMYKNFMFASAEDAGTMIYDLSNPKKLVLKSRIETPGEISGVVVDKDKLFVSDYKGLNIYDISDSMKLESSNKVFKPYLGIIKARIRQNYIFLLYEHPHGGPSCVEILEIPEFKKIQTIKLSGEEIYDIQLQENKLFAIGEHHFYVYDISLICSPRLKYSVYLFSFLRSMNIYQNTVFITGYDSQDTNPDMFTFKLDESINGAGKDHINNLEVNPLGEYVRKVMDADYFDKLLEYGKYIYVTKNRKLFIFLKGSNGIELLYSRLLLDNVRDLSVVEKKDAIYLYLALEDAGLYVIRHKTVQ